MKNNDNWEAINQEHELVEKSLVVQLEHVIQCGKLLALQKAKMEHAEWLPWLILNTDIHREEEAQKFINVAARAKRRKKPLARKGVIRELLYLLSK